MTFELISGRGAGLVLLMAQFASRIPATVKKTYKLVLKWLRNASKWTEIAKAARNDPAPLRFSRTILEDSVLLESNIILFSIQVEQNLQ